MENKDTILKKLYSEDPISRLESIESIKKEGDISIVPELLDFICRQKDNREVIALLTDIKDNSIKNIIIERLKSVENSESKILLTRICWESSLDFSEHAIFFADLMINGEFLLALEISTLLENMLIQDKNSIEKVIATLKKEQKEPQTQLLIDNVIMSLSESL